MLKRWLKQYFANKDEELMTLMLDVLSIIPMSEKAAKDSKIGITLRKISKVEGGFKSKEADLIVNKWRQDVINQREIDEEEKKRIAMEAEMKAKLEEEEAERERIKAEEKRKRKEAEIKLKEERRLKRAEEKPAMVAEQAALSENLRPVLSYQRNE